MGRTVFQKISSIFSSEDISQATKKALEKADDLCEIGYNFQRNEIIYKKIGEKFWTIERLD